MPDRWCSEGIHWAIDRALYIAEDSTYVRDRFPRVQLVAG
jgi:hypothetical protein